MVIFTLSVKCTLIHWVNHTVLVCNLNIHKGVEVGLNCANVIAVRF